VCVVRRMLTVVFCLFLSPAAMEFAFLFIGQGEGELHARRTIQLHGGVWCAVR
jgi:hypothetical protein